MLLEHPWIVKNMAQEVGAPVRRPEIEHLLEPIPIYHIASADDQVVEIFQLSPEEKGETGAAVGMKARLQLYMNRQRL